MIKLRPAEADLLRHYRRCTPDGQTALLASARALAAAAHKKGAS